MGVLILSCPCGLRMKAKGAIPGRVGRCPKCGQTLTVPEPPEARAEPGVGTEAVARGYGLTPTFQPSLAKPGPERLAARGAKRRPVEAARAALPEAAREVEPWWRPDPFFPLRGAEGLMMVAMMGLACWGSMTLIPELCLAFVADSAKMGATMMGVLISLIVSLPGLALGFFAVTYALQYFGRVLVSGAMGEVAPPRPPDRNFDGLSTGLAPWLIWLACGASLGLGPLAAYSFSRGWDEPASLPMVGLLAGLGLPYALMALMMTFLHDGGVPRPFGVVGALVRFNLGFLGLCAFEGGLALLTWGAFAAALALREGYYWGYVSLMLPCWMLAHWLAIVGMRALGVFYHHHASVLRWHREKPWWGVTWGV